MEHEDYMREALSLAREAAQEGEVPVGCVIVKDGEIIGRGRNRREELQRTSSHAEMEAIAQANERLRSWRLDGCTLYVTLEPCPMCAGAIVNARIPRVYYGARDEAMGACGGVLNLFMERFPFRPALVGGILKDECRAVLADFFRTLRSESDLAFVRHLTAGQELLLRHYCVRDIDSLAQSCTVPCRLQTTVAQGFFLDLQGFPDFLSI